MKRLVAAVLLLFSFSAAYAQGGWCGYALIEGLPVLENQLAVIAAITPTRHEHSQPDQLFQYRYNLNHTAVIVEGCFEVDPSREVLVTLLELVVDAPVAESTPEALPPGEVVPPVTPREYIELKLVYSLFAPGGTREESAASVRAYLETNITEWELPAE